MTRVLWFYPVLDFEDGFFILALRYIYTLEIRHKIGNMFSYQQKYMNITFTAFELSQILYHYMVK